MKRLMLAAIVGATVLAGVFAAEAQAPVTVHAAQSYQIGQVVRFTNMDVTLDGHLIRADEAIYDPATGETELRGNVHISLPPHLNNKMLPETVH